MRTEPRQNFTPTQSWRSSLREGLLTAAVWSAAALVAGLLGWMLVDVAVKGVSQLNLEYLTAGVEDAGRAGGIGPVILSTAWILLLTLAIAIPLSLATAIELTAKAGRDTVFTRNVRRCLDVLSGVPSIVFGLFGNAFFAIALGMGYSILTGALTLACMVLPLLIRTFEQGIAAVPLEHRYAAAALGMGRTATLLKVILPAAFPALVAGVVLSAGRALAETAALIFTAGYVARTPGSLLDSGRSISVHIYDLSMNVPHGSSRAYAAACVLIGLLLVINLSAALLQRMAGLAHRPAAGGRL